MRAIPKKVLIHNATHKSVTSRDVWQNPTETTNNLTFVRFDPNDKLVQTATNQEQQLNSVMYYDATNSRPQNVVFSKNDTIEFNGKSFTIVLIETLYNGSKLHHYELGLI